MAEARGPSPGVAACTVISQNYLAQARVLVRSFREQHPQIAVYVLLLDRGEDGFDPAPEEFELVEVDDLSIPDPQRLRFQYSVLEYATAVKPYFFGYLFDKHKLDKLIYLDPDILVLHDLSHIIRLLDDHNIVLTPHITAPIDDDGHEPSELTFLLAGTYNLGFIAMAHRPATRGFLKWWEKRLYNGCYLATDKGMHVDQRWIDLVPSLFEGVHVLKDPGYNVAYWNLHSRRVSLAKGQVLVNGEPCRFFHFSGFDPGDIDRVSKHQDRFVLKALGADARELFVRYRDMLLAAGYQASIRRPYAFGQFDNGVRIPDVVRRIYADQCERDPRFGDPFSTGDRGSFWAWLTEAVDSGVSRLWYEIYQRDAEVQRAYPYVFGAHRDAFLQWASTVGSERYGVDPLLRPSAPGATRGGVAPAIGSLARRTAVASLNVVEPLVKPVLKKLLARHHHLRAKLKGNRDRLVAGASFPVGMGDPLGRRLQAGLRHVLGGKSMGAQDAAGRSDGHLAGIESRPFGVNVAGYVTSQKGTGESVRSYVRALEAVAVPYVLDNVLAEESGHDTSYSDFQSDNPYAFNLICVNADEAANFARHKGEGYYKGRYTIGVWAWELPDFPDAWLPACRYYDELWAPSTFVRDALSARSPVPVLCVPHSIPPDAPAGGLDRAKLGLPAEAFVFLYIFDFHSYLARKNPLGLIEAFKRAFPGPSDAALLIKCARSSFDRRGLTEMRRAAGGASVQILEDTLTREQTNALYVLSDCYVSLHRSEGFGLTLAEAMSAGKPVIATGYGGHRDFMNAESAYLVDYAMTEIEADHGPYKKGRSWAEPDIGHAAELMRHVYENRDEASARGRKGREEIVRLLHPRVVGDAIRRRLVHVADRCGMKVDAGWAAAPGRKR